MAEDIVQEEEVVQERPTRFELPPEVTEAPVEKPEEPKVEAEKPEEPKTDEQPEKRGQSRYERRLDRAFKQRAEAQAERDFYKRQFEEFQAKTAPQPAAPGAPRVEDFSDVEAYAKAYAEHRTAEAIKELETKQRTQAQVQEQARLAQNWEMLAAKADRKYDDFDEKVGNLKPTQPWSAALMAEDNGDDIAYFLGTHLEDAKRIIALDPLGQAREIGKLAAKLASEPKKQPPTSNAPAPIAPVAAVSNATSSEPSEHDDIETWIKKRRKQVYRR